jgi:hypothetical protein
MAEVATAPTNHSSFTFTNRVIVFGHAEFIQSGDTHETILQALNRWMDYEDKDGTKFKIFLDTEAFQGTEAAWDVSPPIFAQEHPEDFALVESDIEAALNTVKDYEGNPGSVPGTLTETKVVIPGQPRLTSRITFTNPKMQGLYDEGKLSLSTGFTCDVGNDGHLVGKVRPNHVLVFVQDDKIQPRDKAAMFLNAEHIQEDYMEATHAGRVISDKNQSRFKQAVDALTALFNEMTGTSASDYKKSENTGPSLPAKTPDIPATNQDKDKRADEMAEAELKNQIEAANTTIAAKDAEIVNRDAKIKTLEDKNLELSNTLAAADKARKDAAWTELKNTLPKGLIDVEKDTIGGFTPETADKDPLAFANKIAAVKMKAPTQVEGDEHPPAEKGTPVVNTGIGTWDAKNRCYKD